jgi:hypothetical protein
MAIKIYEEEIGPDRAGELLEKNVFNRRITPQYLNILIGAMERGEWKFNGDSIRIDKQGRVLDGQHRLQAVLRTGITIRVIMIEGLDPEVMDTIDVGKRRNFADILSISGHKNVHETASALRKIEQCLVGKGNAKRLTIVQLENMLKGDWADIVTKVQYCRTCPRYVAPCSAVAAAYALFSRVNKVHAKRFIDGLTFGEGIDRTAIKVLREQLMNNKTASHRYHTKQLMAVIIVAWEAYRKGQIPDRIVIPAEFPQISRLKL